MADAGTVSYTYNADGTLATVTDAKSQRKVYTYDSYGRITQIARGTVSGGTFTENIAQRTSYTYSGTNSGFSVAGPFSETRTYNVNLELTELTSGSNVHYKYNYSATQNNGQIVSQNDVISGETITNQYDTLKRLISASATGDPHGSWFQNFAVDGFGNLNQITGTNAPALSVAIDYTTNRIQSSAGYDANGNMAGYAGSSYSYDIENRMVQSTPSSGGTVQYGYDSTNQRIYKGAYSGGTYSGEEIYFYGAEGHKYGTWQINPSSGVLLKASVTKQWFGNRLVSPQDRLDSRGKYFRSGRSGRMSLRRIRRTIRRSSLRIRAIRRPVSTMQISVITTV